MLAYEWFKSELEMRKCCIDKPNHFLISLLSLMLAPHSTGNDLGFYFFPVLRSGCDQLHELFPIPSSLLRRRSKSSR